MGSWQTAHQLTASPARQRIDPVETPLEYEFYRELQEYEVLVDATLVDLSAQDPNRRLERDYLLQTGA